MGKIIYKIHIWIGLAVSIPVFGWAVSGFLYAMPNAVEGGTVEVIASGRVKIGPEEAIAKAHEYAGRKLPTTALTLLMRDGSPYYQAIGGMGADSILINAETGEVIKTPPPGPATRFFRQAHFFFFAGRWQVPILLLFSGLAAVSAVTGIYLNFVYWLVPGPGRRSEAEDLREQ